MAENLLRSIDRSPAAQSDWPTLIERAIDDISRILRSEAQILQTSIGAGLELQITKTVKLLTIVGILLSGVLCILGAAIACSINGSLGGSPLASPAWSCCSPGSSAWPQ